MFYNYLNNYDNSSALGHTSLKNIYNEPVCYYFKINSLIFIISFYLNYS